MFDLTATANALFESQPVKQWSHGKILKDFPPTQLLLLNFSFAFFAPALKLTFLWCFLNACHEIQLYIHISAF